MKILDQKDYDDWKANQGGDGKDPMGVAYGLACFTYAERWADLMEAELAANPNAKFEEFANRLSHDADVEGITGFMYGVAVSILSKCWVHGERLRNWHNLDIQIGTEGEKANTEGGVLNPALLSFEKKD